MSIGDRLLKFLLFGTGDYYNRFKHWFDTEDVVALVDNSQDKQGTQIDAVCVLSPIDAIKQEYDYIIILSFYVTQMRKQLMDLDVPKEKILHFYELGKVLSLKEQTDFEVPVGVQGQKILLLSHDLNLGGPSLALMHMAEVLKKRGNYVVFASMIEGPLRLMIEEKGISVVVDNNLQIGVMDEITWTHQFDVIVANTINYYNFLAKRDTNISTIWWLHDHMFFYDGVDKSILKNLDTTNLKIASVSDISSDALNTYRPDLKVKKLIFAVEDEFDKRKKSRSEKITFLIIGYIEYRKGQDILVDALDEISPEILKRTEFIFIGQDNSTFADDLKRRVQGRDYIRIMGKVDRKEIDSQMNHADALIVPSREEPMSMVSVEAMMHEVPCIVSDVSGISEFIQSGEDGIIVKALDIEILKEKIEWAINHREELRDMGKKSRKIYENVFSLEVFERNLMSLMDG